MNVQASTQSDKARHFRSLHVAGEPLVLFNIWDAGSAHAVTSAGARALATGSWAVAAASGLGDGERMPLDCALQNLSRIVATSALPVSVDLESGYGETPDAVAGTVRRAIAAGAVGCNLEDSHPADGSLRAVDEQARRLGQARTAADASGVALFINARSDVFFRQSRETHDASMVEEALARGRAYAAVGADGLFVPGLADEGLIEQLVRASPLPVNIMVGPGSPPLARLAAIGVARVSHGPGPYLAAMEWLGQAAARALTR